MANKKMSYGKARTLNRTGLGRLMVNRIVSGQGVGSSITSSISDKTVAKLVRIKEKFDPMNIGKMLGGRLGAYAVGKLTGRSNDDISYFTGTKIKSVEEKKNPLVTKVQEGATAKMKKGDGLADVLSKIYNLIKSSYADMKTEKEVQHNLEKEKEEKREKFHKDLIRALSGMGTAVPTAAPVKDKSGGLLGMIKDLFDSLMNTTFGKTLKDIVEFFTEGGLFQSLKSVFNVLKNSWLVEALVAPEAMWAALLAAGVIGAVELGTKLRDIIQEKQEDDARKQGGQPAVEALRKLQASHDALNESGYDWQGDETAAKEEYDKAVQIRPKLVNNYMTQKGYVLKTTHGNTFWRDRKGKAASNDLLKEADDYATNVIDKGPAAVAKELPATKSATPAPEPKKVTLPATGAGGGRGSVMPELPKPMAAPVAQTNQPEVRVQAAIAQNNDLNLEPNKPQVISIDKSSVTNTGGGSSGPALTMESSVLVRTDDPTLQKILAKNVRTV